jgi:hypothetical protein
VAGLERWRLLPSPRGERRRTLVAAARGQVMPYWYVVPTRSLWQLPRGTWWNGFLKRPSLIDVLARSAGSTAQML